MTTTDDSLPDLGPAAMAVAALVDREIGRAHV